MAIEKYKSTQVKEKNTDNPSEQSTLSSANSLDHITESSFALPGGNLAVFAKSYPIEGPFGVNGAILISIPKPTIDDSDDFDFTDFDTPSLDGVVTRYENTQKDSDIIAINTCTCVGQNKCDECGEYGPRIFSIQYTTHRAKDVFRDELAVFLNEVTGRNGDGSIRKIDEALESRLAEDFSDILTIENGLYNYRAQKFFLENIDNFDSTLPPPSKPNPPPFPGNLAFFYNQPKTTLSFSESLRVAGGVIAAAGGAGAFFNKSLVPIDNQSNGGQLQSSPAATVTLDNNLLLGMLAFSTLIALSLLYVVFSSCTKKLEENAGENMKLKM